MLLQSSEQFIDLVRKSGLVDEAALQQILDDQEPADSQRAAERMVTAGVLTRFQAKMLLTGRSKGLVLGPYRILDQIGRGGMGIVYLAQHQKLERRVAVKVLPKERTTDRLSLDRFYREARAVAALDHPNIVKAYDVGECMGVHYFVMEYVRGVTLQQHLDEKGPIPWKAATRCIAQACSGLQHAHKRGLVHRDIKPSNLLMDGAGTLKILDLGLARFFNNAKDNLTANLGDGSEFTGSVDYIAPEQADASRSADIRADIYSLGATYHALVTGKPPFAGNAAQKLLQHQMKQPPLLHELRPEVPHAVSAIVATMMHKRPEQRYASPAEVMAALTPWLPASLTQRGGAQSDIHVTPSKSPRRVIELPEERDSDRDTKDIVDEATQVDIAGSTQDISIRQRRKRRAKKKKAARRQRLVLFASLAALLFLPLIGWGGYALTHRPPATTETQVAAAAVKPQAQPPAPSVPPTIQPPPATDGPGPQVNEAAPEIEGEDLNGDCFLLSDYRGKVVLLDFFGFW